ncbi:hypothetical protein EPN28_02565 [Patescibacteria group bacterium]|nr:MAG: hypothetical protein EPN28_02565 [Patescibacteria group bacterium]
MDTPNTTPGKGNVIKNIYLYLVSFVALMMMVFSTADIINTLLRTYVFTKADKFDYYVPHLAGCESNPPKDEIKKIVTSSPGEKECAQINEEKKNAEENRAAQRQRDLVRDISMIVVGIPLFAFHWRIIRKKETV